MAIRVTYQYSSDSLWMSSDTDGVDTDASEERFEQQLRDKVAEVYPDVEFEIERGINDGVKVSGDTIEEYGDEEEVRLDIESIGECVWDSFGWVVYKA